MPAQGAPPEENDLRVLQVCEGILRLSERSPSTVWPGYNLATRPLVVYRANRWALLLRDKGSEESFGPYPSDWPPLNHPSRLHPGPRKELSGQLVFDYPVGGSKAVAVGVPDPEDAARAAPTKTGKSTRWTNQAVAPILKRERRTMVAPCDAAA